MLGAGGGRRRRGGGARLRPSVGLPSLALLGRVGGGAEQRGNGMCTSSEKSGDDGVWAKRATEEEFLRTR